MTRPTREGVTHTTDLLWHLAHQDPDTYHDLAALTDLLVWLHGEITAAREAAAYGSGISEVHVLGSTSRGVEARLNDKFLADLTAMRTSWRSQLYALLCNLQDDAQKAANWPMRTTEAV